MIPWLILTAVLVGSAGWIVGHRTARIRIIPIGAILAEDQAALAAQDVAEFWQIVGGLDLDQPDDPRSST
ncbi:hypothetical protein NC239_33690 [Streptomyces sp. G3]|uniref:hypothetical protein n=1 Tax=Streptomyces sp. G3 TaxID=690144 RepID=UPI00202EFC7D|nr:hypothetical protein [Streptomyces sp. G3]MCM1943167.1 hypothetical protein [Streptomyces sp. G3]